ncbi:MAG TPA: cation-translocating P-type ATPase [Puia sp.]|jgi:Ca2+-transporting ATPase|nr:cation-translocating P-type ATPase [Puia sp.]
MEPNMVVSTEAESDLSGLSTVKAGELLKTAGRNSFTVAPERHVFRVIIDLVKTPMFLLLLVACMLYFILGEPKEGLLMLVAMVFVGAISVYQEVKSSKALAALKKYTEPRAKCKRDGKLVVIPVEELVPGDIILVEEGGLIPADALIVQSNDFSVNESIVTGESFPVSKDERSENRLLYQGSTVNSGKCYARITSTGAETLLARIGRATAGVGNTKTVLQRQIGRYVRAMTIFGISAFMVVWSISYLRTSSFAESLLLGLTLAMSAIPEEIPVAFSSFLALGAWRMARRGIIVRQPLTIEDLGAVTVICLDKTGTLTENKMKVSAFYDRRSEKEEEIGDGAGGGEGLSGSNVLWYARLACEPEPFDAMEQAIVTACPEESVGAAYRSLKFIHEYPLEGRPPMMSHVYERDGKVVVAAKGGPERIVQVCKLDPAAAAALKKRVAGLAAKGYRVLGVASAEVHAGGLPERQDDFNWQLEGLIALFDPPRQNLKEMFASWKGAGIRVVIISGDYAETISTVAASAGLGAGGRWLTGEKVSLFSDEQLRGEVSGIDIYARMFPDAKLRVIQALEANGETVAMTGDGVNDGPALKAAHIGIAMGNKGTETAREAADLILSDDDLGKISEAILQGRTIYENLKKAIRYLITIHIPILTTASLPMLLGWSLPILFTPIHVIFLELIMGPTCSIFYEREPVEENIMRRPPRVVHKGLLYPGELAVTVLQGVMAASGLLVLYYYFMQHGYSVEYTRTVVFTTLLFDNILLTFVNRSYTETVMTTFRYRNSLVMPVFLLSIGFLVVINFLPFVTGLFGLTAMVWKDVIICLGVSALTIGWFEIFKALRKKG